MKNVDTSPILTFFSIKTADSHRGPHIHYDPKDWSTRIHKQIHRQDILPDPQTDSLGSKNRSTRIYKIIHRDPQTDPRGFTTWIHQDPQPYWVTQNKVPHLLAILYLICEVNITQESYVIQCIIANEVQLNKVQFWKCLSQRNISNSAVNWQTTRFEIFFWPKRTDFWG